MWSYFLWMNQKNLADICVSMNMKVWQKSEVYSEFLSWTGITSNKCTYTGVSMILAVLISREWNVVYSINYAKFYGS